MVASQPSCIRSEPSPSNTITRRSGRASASPAPMADAPPMKPMQPTERSSGAMSRHAGEVVMVGMQMALPRAAWIAFSASSGLMAMSDRLQPDQHRRWALALAAQPVILGNEVHVVRTLQRRVRDAEGVEQWLGEADHRVARFTRGLVLLAAEQPDHVEHRNLAVHGHAAQR